MMSKMVLSTRISIFLLTLVCLLSHGTRGNDEEEEEDAADEEEPVATTTSKPVPTTQKVVTTTTKPAPVTTKIPLDEIDSEASDDEEEPILTTKKTQITNYITTKTVTVLPAKMTTVTLKTKPPTTQSLKTTVSTKSSFIVTTLKAAIFTTMPTKTQQQTTIKPITISTTLASKIVTNKAVQPLNMPKMSTSTTLSATLSTTTQKTTFKFAVKTTTKRKKAAVEDEGDYWDVTTQKSIALAPLEIISAENVKVKETCVTCPEFECKKDPAMFSTAGNLVVPYMFGKLLSACGYQYVFSNIQMTSVEAATACCYLGLQLMSLESQAEMDCVAKLYAASFFGRKSFWTSATDEGCKGTFDWCSNTGGDNFNKDSPWWRPNEPNNFNNEESCVELVFAQWKAGRINDGKCSEKKNFICKGKSSSAVQQEDTQMKPKLLLPNAQSAPITSFKELKCLDFKCFTDPKKFNSDGSLKAIPSLMGELTIIANKQYIFSNAAASWTEAQESCCAFGMRLIAMDTLSEFQILGTLNNVLVRSSTEFWTDGSDEGIEGKFWWCGSRKPVSMKLTWRDKNPDNRGGRENCLAIVFKVASFSYDSYTKLDDRECINKYRYICEQGDAVKFSDVSNIVTTGKAYAVTAGPKKN